MYRRHVFFLALLPVLLLLAVLLGAVATPAPPLATAQPQVIPVGSHPTGVWVNPIAKRIYVTNSVDNTVSVIKGDDNTVLATIPVGSGPSGVWGHAGPPGPPEGPVYVANEWGGSVSVIDGSSNTVVATIPVGMDPRGVAVNPDTNLIYVANKYGNSVSVIMEGTNTVVATVPVGMAPWGVAVNPDTNRIYVANEWGGSVSVIDGNANNTVVATVPVGAAPWAVAVNPKTNQIYVTRPDGTVSDIDGFTNTVVATVSPGGGPWGVAVNRDANHIYVSNSLDNWVTVIDGGTDTVATVPVGSGPSGVAVNPITNRIYVANSGDNTVSVIEDPMAPCLGDSDCDGMPDAYEVLYACLKPIPDAFADFDGDTLTNITEMYMHTDPCSRVDTDGDTLNDGFEVSIGTNPLDPDTDHDGFFDGVEHNLGSDPLNNLSTPEHTSVVPTCMDLIDNDLDGTCDMGGCPPVPPALVPMPPDPGCFGGPPPPDVTIDTGFPPVSGPFCPPSPPLPPPAPGEPCPMPDGTPAGMRGQPITVTKTWQAVNVRITVAEPDAVPQPPEIQGLMTDISGVGAVWTYTYTIPHEPEFPAPGAWQIGMNTSVTMCRDADGDGDYDDDCEVAGVYLFDPSGKVFDADTVTPIAGATVTLKRLNPAQSTYVEMSSPLNAGMFQPEVNPQTTGSDGSYAWNVVAGQYLVEVSMAGCSPATSEAVSVPPPATNLDVFLTCPDTDGDHLNDVQELTVYHTDPNVVDTDHGGAPDGLEVNQGTDPLNPGDDAAAVNTDADSDGCVSSEELGPMPTLGGQRDPLNPWDFFDVPRPVGAPGTGTRDKQIDGNDALAVLAKFGASPGDPIPTAPKYDPAYDRSTPSPHPWNTHAPNGVQDGNDVIWALAQFGHSCFAPP